MTRVQEMSKGITIDDPSSDIDNQPTETVSKSKPKDQPKPLMAPAMNWEPVKQSLEEDSAGNDKVQKTETRHSAKERAVAGYDSRLGQTSGANQSGPRSRIISDIAINLKRQGTNNNRIGSALNRLHNAGTRLSLRPDVEYIEIPPANMPYSTKGRGKSPKDNPTWLCNLYMGDILLASVEAGNKPNSKAAASEKAVSILESSAFTVTTEKKVSKLGRTYSKEVVPWDQKRKSQTFPANVQNGCGAAPPTWTLDKFILTEPKNPTSSVGILINSAQSNHVQILFETSDDIHTVNGQTGYVCETIINGVTIATAVHMNQKSVRYESADKALALLKQTCPILRKNPEKAQDIAIKRDEISSERPSKSKYTAIDESNIGHKILKLMGWTGGALAKDGIVEPIQASEKVSREGFGFSIPVPKDSKTHQIDMKAVRKVIEDYVCSGQRDDLIFTSALSKDERKAIHLTCARFNLKSQSYGKRAERYLVIRQKRSVNELVQDVVESGGTCGQYELISPGQ